MSQLIPHHLLVGLIVLATHLAPVDAAVIHLRESVAVSESIVRLGHIARIEHDDPQIAHRLRTLPLAPTPVNGRSLAIDAASITRRLSAARLNTAGIQFGGSPSTLVARSRQATDRSQPRPTVSIRLRKARAIVGGAIEERLKQKSLDWMLIHESLKLNDALVSEILVADPRTIEIAGGQLPLDAPQRLQITYRTLNGPVRQTTAVCRLCPTTTVWQVDSSVRRGETILRSDLVPDRQRSAAGRIVDVNQVVGKIATRTLHRGARVKPSDVRKAKLVKTGDLVTVTSSVGGISVETEMKARGVGGEGDSITLESLDRRNRVQAMITGPRTAEVATRPAPEISGLRVLQSVPTTDPDPTRSATPRASRSATRALRTTQTSQSRFQKGIQP